MPVCLLSLQIVTQTVDGDFPALPRFFYVYMLLCLALRSFESRVLPRGDSGNLSHVFLLMY